MALQLRRPPRRSSAQRAGAADIAARCVAMRRGYSIAGPTSLSTSFGRPATAGQRRERDARSARPSTCRGSAARRASRRASSVTTSARYCRHLRRTAGVRPASRSGPRPTMSGQIDAVVGFERRARACRSRAPGATARARRRPRADSPRRPIPGTPCDAGPRARGTGHGGGGVRTSAAFVDETREGRLVDDRSKQRGRPRRGVAETARRAAHKHAHWHAPRHGARRARRRARRCARRHARHARQRAKRRARRRAPGRRAALREASARLPCPAPYFSCTDPLTLAVTLPVPAPTGSASPTGAAIARIIIGRGGLVLPPSVCTLTSRTV